MYVVRHPAGGGFLEPEPISDTVDIAAVRDIAATLSDTGEFAVTWSEGGSGGPPDVVRVATGTLADGAGETATFSDEQHELRSNQLATDSSGRMMLLWQQTPRDERAPDGTTRVFPSGPLWVSRRLPGGRFEAPEQLPYTDDETADGKFGLDGEGNATFAWSGRVVKVMTGPFDGPYDAPETPLGTSGADTLRLAVAGSGAALLTYARGDSTAASGSLRRQPGGSFGWQEDLRPACGQVTVHSIDIDDQGRAAAITAKWSDPYSGERVDGTLELILDGPADAPRQQCGRAAAGSGPPAASAGGGESPAETPGASPAPEVNHPDGRVPHVTLRGRGLRRLLHTGRGAVIVRCDESCRVRLDAKLELSARRPVALAHAARAAGSGFPATVSVRLSHKLRRAALRRVRRGEAVRLQVLARAVDGSGNQSRASLHFRLR
jgi:hypothetical protein